MRILLPHERTALIYDVLTEYTAISSRLDFGHAKQALASHEAKLTEDTQLWQAAGQWLRRHNAQLISELPGLLLDKIKAGDLGDRQYKYVIVDEFQDLTPGLQSLFLKLRTKFGHFMGLGDPRQSIYAFLGNDIGGLSRISDLVAPESVTDISMTECQRCPPDIVKAANQLTSLSGVTPMSPGNSDAANIHVVHWDQPLHEANGMAEAIIRNVKAHPSERHLVMVTRRKFGYMLRDEMIQIDPSIEVDLNFSESLLETWVVREAFLFFCLIADPDSPTWRAWFAYKNSTNGKDFKAAQRNSGAYLNFLSDSKDSINDEKVAALATKDRQSGSGGKNLIERAKRFVELQKAFPGRDADPIDILDSVFEIANWNGTCSENRQTSETDMKLAHTKTREIYEDVSLKKPKLSSSEKLANVARILRYQIATKEPFTPSKSAPVQIMTLWGAKGVTSDHVYILGLCKEALPGTRRDEYPGSENDFFEEQRRLFYVSITRAKKTMILSRATKIKRSDAQKLGLEVTGYSPFYPKLQMCDFLRDIMNYLPSSVAGSEWNGCSK